MKELKNVFEGRVLVLYQTIVNAMRDLKFEVVKKKLIKFVKRKKKSIRFEKKNDFEDARMSKNESVQEYAWKIDALA